MRGVALLLAALMLPQAVLADRVLALGGAVTETIHALGQGHRLIARDTTSSYPPEVLELPDVGYVRALSPEGVLSVRPDLIIAEEGAGPPETVDILKAAGIPFHQIASGEDEDSVIARIEAVAEALGTPEAAATLLAAIRADFAALAAARDAVDRPARVMFILSLQGGRVLAAGQDSGADAMLRLAGAENAVAGFSGYKPLTDEAITAAAPDIILMMNRGEADSDHGASDAALLAMPAIATTPAARNGRVIRMDGLYLLGFGPRTGQAALDLHRALYEVP
ncbi:ABC transporter substrate-binding protein [Paracoccus bogoriensis]|uniref:heme/hemin ABC transporter substrate-binding protein n=1 Tax=Paracoccus bogoriensis TaxID=242065 RepID=UPI001CA4EE23|nr:ABC transporter substrate-binding protein [Paracoccus bogoriensis]MBW7057073.1 ABC transporter substrate-binding protein [Paracoccus bogoriensis]